MLVPTTIAVAQKPMTPKREPGSIRVKDTEDSAGPTTTVFVGNISEKASDMLVRQLLAVSWLSATTPPVVVRQMFKLNLSYKEKKLRISKAAPCISHHRFRCKMVMVCVRYPPKNPWVHMSRGYSNTVAPTFLSVIN